MGNSQNFGCEYGIFRTFWPFGARNFRQALRSHSNCHCHQHNDFVTNIFEPFRIIRMLMEKRLNKIAFQPFLGHWTYQWFGIKSKWHKIISVSFHYCSLDTHYIHKLYCILYQCVLPNYIKLTEFIKKLKSWYNYNDKYNWMQTWKAGVFKSPFPTPKEYPRRVSWLA